MMRVRIHRTGKIADNYARKAAATVSGKFKAEINFKKSPQKFMLDLKHANFKPTPKIRSRLCNAN